MRKRPRRIGKAKPTAGPASRGRTSSLGFLTVGETARIIGISPSTLRVWENVGLVTPARSNGRFRLYTPEAIEVLKRIKHLRDGKQLTVPGIKQALGDMNTTVAAKRPERPGLGSTLRKMRERCGLGVAEAARKAKVSAGFLSSIELSRANASVATLQRLTAAYGTTVLEFLDLPSRSSRLVRPRDRKVLETEDRIRMERLSFGNAMLECMLFTVPAKTGSNGAYSHAGEEFIFMLSGTLELWLNEIECHILNPGDSFWFESTMGHRFLNTSKENAVLVWVNTPPTF